MQKKSPASVHKTTVLGDFMPNNNGLFHKCPWRFDDTLTFTACMSDALRPGLTLRLRAEKDFHLGPLQLDFSKFAEVGITGVDLKRCVLPACVCSPCSSEDSRWESPPIVVPYIKCTVVSAQRVKFLDSLSGM